MSTNPELKRTPLYDRHVAAGAKLVEFAGWEMPVQYAGVIDEHRAVRTAAGLFDVSHMGEFRVAAARPARPRRSSRASRRTTSRSSLRAGRTTARLLTPEGTFVDDLLVYRIGDDEFLIVVNAAQHRARLRLDRGARRGRPA